MDSKTIRRKHKQYLFPAAKNFYKDPVVVTDGKNACVKDLEGNSYLDFFAGILTISVGHCNDEVNDAVKEQIDRLIHIFDVNNGYELIGTIDEHSSTIWSIKFSLNKET